MKSLFFSTMVLVFASKLNGLVAASPKNIRSLNARAITFLGTKWCGEGTNAQNYNDLGPLEETDKCCRTHDLCDDEIHSGQTRYNLTNTAMYTRVACKCDDTFYACLKQKNSASSNTVGYFYFNLLRTKCFREDMVCTKRNSQNICVSSELKYGWFSVPKY